MNEALVKKLRLTPEMKALMDHLSEGLIQNQDGY